MPASNSVFAGGPFAPGGAFKGGSPFAAGAGFDVDPATIRAGARPLNGAAGASRAHGDAAADRASDAAAGVEGAGRLGGLMLRFGAEVAVARERFAAVLEAGATTLEATAQGYTNSDRPLTGAP